MKTANLALVLAAMLALSSFAAPAAAVESNFEIFAGGFFPDSFDHDEFTYGVRGGFRFSDRWGLQGSLGRVELWDDGGHFWDVDLNATFLDISAMLFVNPRSKAELFFYGGPGMAFFDIGVGGVGPGFIVWDDDFTLHAGAGLNVRLSDRMYLRPDVRVRWLGAFDDGFDDGGTDFEATLALGWKFGGGR